MIKLWTTEREERAKRPIPYEYQIRGIIMNRKRKETK